MKKYNPIIFFTLALLLSSCADLDLYPLDTGSSDSWYKTEEQIKASISGLYRVDFFPIDDERWSDNHQARNNLNDYTGATLNGESWYVKDRWQKAYKAIARCNVLLDKLSDPSPIGITEERAELYRAQVLFIRATQYGILTSSYGDVVYVDKELSIEESFRVGRTDREEIMEHVYEDYDRASKSLPLTYGSSQELATKAAALALKARYALYNEDWEIAAQAAKDCIGLGSNELYPDFSELFLASTHHASEVLLSHPHSLELGIYSDSPGNIQGYSPRNRGGYASEYPSWELFASFLCTDGLPIDESPLFDPHDPFRNRDPRCAATIVEFGTEHCGVIYDPNPLTTEVYSKTHGKNITNLDCKSGSQYASYNGLLRKKGVDDSWINDGSFQVAYDRIFIRMAEVYLTYAEAMIESGNIDDSVLDAINIVRARAYKADYKGPGYPKVTTTDRDRLRSIVRVERRMELAYEGHRRMDIIRWKIADKVLNTPDYGLLDKDALVSKIIDRNMWFWPETPEIDENGTADFSSLYSKGLCKIITRRQFDSSKNYLWPIPSQEVITNPYLGQNDNY